MLLDEGNGGIVVELGLNRLPDRGAVPLDEMSDREAAELDASRLFDNWLDKEAVLLDIGIPMLVPVPAIEREDAPPLLDEEGNDEDVPVEPVPTTALDDKIKRMDIGNGGEIAELGIL